MKKAAPDSGDGWNRVLSPAQRRQLKRIRDGHQPRNGREVRSANALVRKAMVEVAPGSYRLTELGQDVWAKGRK